MVIKFSDLIDDYPETDDNNFQSVISSKQEFIELSSEPRETLSGKYFRHQQWVQRYLMVYDNLFVFHKTGTGKTCTIVATSENFRKQHQLGLTNIKRCIILVASETLVDEFKRELVCKCSDGKYLSTSQMRTNTERAQRGLINRLISEWYEITTYRKFSKQLMSMNDDEKVKTYSGYLFFVDEVHNLTRSEVSAAEASAEISTEGEPIGETLKIKSKQAGALKRAYEELHKLFHTIQRSKVVIATATPMINEPTEIASVLNLILPMEKQLLPSMIDEMEMDDIEPYLRGKISYVRELDTGAYADYQGVKIGDLEEDSVEYQTVIDVLDIDPQSVQGRGLASAIIKDTETNDNWYGNSRQASNFVFPDGSWGGNPRDQTKGYGKYVGAIAIKKRLRKDTKERTEQGTLPSMSSKKDEFIAGTDLQEIFKTPETLKQYSVKYARSLDIINNSKGNCFCYGVFKYGSGTVMLGLALQYSGYERYTRNVSAFKGKRSVVKPYCATDDKAEKEIVITKAPRFALLTSDTAPTRFNSILELFNSYENRHGEYLKCIIGSPVSKEGLNLSNCVTFINIDPQWHQSGMYQAMSRTIRSTSHVELLKEEAEKATRERRDPKMVKVAVKIYNLASRVENNSVDIYMYRHAEEKEIGIKRVERMLKRSAVDCLNHYERNVRPTDVNGSKDCDYEKCEYSCYSPAPWETDIKNWQLLYADEALGYAIDIIRAFFVFNAKITYDDMKQRLFKDYLDNGNPEFLIVRAIHKIVDENIPIVNSLGYRMYLHIQGSILYTIRGYPRGREMSIDSHYSSYHTIMDQKSFKDYITTQIVEKEKKEIQRGQVQNISLITMIDEFEKEFNPDKEIEDKFGRFRNNIFIIPKPLGRLMDIEETLAGKGKYGRPTEKKLEEIITVPKLKFNEILEDIKNPDQPMLNSLLGDTFGDDVLIHTIYSQETKETTGYGITARQIKTDQLRIYDTSEESPEWRWLSPAEKVIYGQIIQYENVKKFERFENEEVYGTMFNIDSKFRIRDKTKESAKAKTDSRSMTSGKVCTTFAKDELYSYLYYFNILPQKYEMLQQSVKTFSRDRQIQMIQSKSGMVKGEDISLWSNDKILFYAIWSNVTMTREDMCDYIFNRMEELDLIMYD
jgi:hypothetical protein